MISRSSGTPFPGLGLERGLGLEAFGAFMAKRPPKRSGGATGAPSLAAQLVLAGGAQAVGVGPKWGLVGFLDAAQDALALAVLALGTALLGDGLGPLPCLLPVLQVAHR